MRSVCCKERTAGVTVVVIQIVEAILIAGLATLALKEISFLQSEEADEEYKAKYTKTLKGLFTATKQVTAQDNNVIAFLITFVSLDFVTCGIRIFFAILLLLGFRKESRSHLTAWMVYKLVDIIFMVIFSPTIFFHIHLPLNIKPVYDFVTITSLVIAMLMECWFIKIVYDIRHMYIHREVEESKIPPVHRVSTISGNGI